MKIIFIYLILTFSSFLYADESSWTDSEISILKDLWIKSLPDRPENKFNQVAENTLAIELGKKLFFDKRLSSNGEVACASCHKPKLNFTDGRKTSKGLDVVTRNAPSIVGISYSNWFFHDGRADSLWSQALIPLENEKEHNSNRNFIAHFISSNINMKKQYEKIFGEMPDINDKQRFPENAGPVKNKILRARWKAMNQGDREVVTNIFVNVGKSIAAYETLLNPSPSKFDTYVKSVLNNKEEEKKIFTEAERSGLRLFISKAKCIICHSGPLFSDFEFHNIATPPVSNTVLDWGRYSAVHSLMRSEFNCYSKFNDDKEKRCDELKYMVKDKEHTIGSFKTPSLRNVTKTAPYMHAGQYKNLKSVMKHYADTPETAIGRSELLALNIELSKKDEEDIIAFLKTLESVPSILKNKL